MTIRGGRIVLIPREAGFVVLLDVAPNDVLIRMKRERGKPVCTSQVFIVLKYSTRATTNCS